MSELANMPVPASPEPERARKKLERARARTERLDAEGTLSSVRRNSLLVWYAVINVLVLSAFVLLAPEKLHPSAWGTEPYAPIILAITTWLFVGALIQARRKRRADSSELLVRDFYDRLGGDSKVSGLARFVLPEDFDHAERRATPFGPKATLSQIGSGRELDSYWNTLFAPKLLRNASLSVDAVRVQEIESDLRIAYVTLDVRRLGGFGKWLFFCSLMGVAFAVKEANSTTLAWPIVSAAAVAFLGVTFVVRRMVQSLGKHRVRKLLVYTGGQWRLFCGEWEGHEEADLSWLDSPPEAKP